jgi:hypothetical protein
VPLPAACVDRRANRESADPIAALVCETRVSGLPAKSPGTAEREIPLRALKDESAGSIELCSRVRGSRSRVAAAADRRDPATKNDRHARGVRDRGLVEADPTGSCMDAFERHSSKHAKLITRVFWADLISTRARTISAVSRGCWHACLNQFQTALRDGFIFVYAKSRFLDYRNHVLTHSKPPRMPEPFLGADWLNPGSRDHDVALRTRCHVSSISRCRRCDELRQDLLMVRVPAGRQAAWQCPECSVAWAPVTFATALATAQIPLLHSLPLPTLCPCPAGGPFALVRRTSGQLAWLWLCCGCGTGQKPIIGTSNPHSTVVPHLGT